MKLIKKMIAASLALGLMLSMYSGCGMFTNYKAIAEQALEDKYGEEFICYSTWDEGTKYCYAKLSPKNNQNMKFQATISRNGSIIADEYIEKVVAEMCMDIMEEYLNKIGTKYTYHASINDFNDIFSSRDDVTIESYFNQEGIIYPSLALAVCFSNKYIVNTDYETEYNIIINMLSDDKLKHLQDVSFRFFFVPEEYFSSYEDYFNSTVLIHYSNTSLEFYGNSIDFGRRSSDLTLDAEKYVVMREEMNYV